MNTSTSIKDFQIISKLGEGSYSNVFKVKRQSDGKLYALKKVKLNGLTDKEKENALNEVRILASIKNPYIIGYKEAFLEENIQCLCIVMEFASGGDIYNKIQEHTKKGTHFPELQIWKYFLQMIKGLKGLHDLKILHRDLKCANVFISVDDDCAKLGDLNVSKVAKNNLVYTQTGTPYYASPEVWRDEPYGLKSDIWSLGCVLYEMITLKPPFRANDMSGLYKKVQKGQYDKIPSQYSNDLALAVDSCLKVSVSSRPTCDGLLNMPQIKKYINMYIKDDYEYNVTNNSNSNQLLNTIKLPGNLRVLSSRLPKANYDSHNQKNNKQIDDYDEFSCHPSRLPPLISAQIQTPSYKPKYSEPPVISKIAEIHQLKQQQQQQQQKNLNMNKPSQIYNEQNLYIYGNSPNYGKQAGGQQVNGLPPISSYQRVSSAKNKNTNTNNILQINEIINQKPTRERPVSGVQANAQQKINQDRKIVVPQGRSRIQSAQILSQNSVSRVNNYYADKQNDILSNIFQNQNNPKVPKPVRPFWWG